jgi:DNA polymerase I-like protein with 3'-5' exonuclease and polymerase domains
MEVEDDVLTRGYTTNPFGRRRYYFGRQDSDAARHSVVREAIADGPQSANAMALNAALQRLHEKYDPDLLRVLQNVHDEILLDCAPKDLGRVARVVKEEMEQTFSVEGRSFVIPAEVNATTTNWADMKEVHT